MMLLSYFINLQVFTALKKSTSDIGMSIMEISKITSHLSVAQVGVLPRN